VRHYLPGLRFSPRLVDRPTLRAIRGYSIDALVAMVAGRVSFQTDAVVINVFLLPQCITPFAVAGRLVEYAKDSLRVATTVLTPAVSALEAKGDSAGIRTVFLDSTRYVLWLILPVQLGLLLLGRPFLFLWMGPEYAELSYPTLAILAAPLALSLSQSVSVRILYGTGRLRWFARLVMAEAFANLLLSVLLVRPCGIEGVAVGTAIPNVITNLVLAVYLCRVLGVGAGEYLRRSFLVPCAAALIPCSLWLVIGYWPSPTSWLSLVSTGIVGVIGYAFLAAYREIGFRSLITRLRTSQESVPAPVVTATMIIATPDTKEPGCASSPTPLNLPCEV
jgi:O-antigen/teichoic acid export membrane protein